MSHGIPVEADDSESDSSQCVAEHQSDVDAHEEPTGTVAAILTAEVEPQVEVQECNESDPDVGSGTPVKQWGQDDITIWYKVTSKMVQRSKCTSEAHSVIDRRREMIKSHVSSEMMDVLAEGLEEIWRTVRAATEKGQLKEA